MRTFFSFNIIGKSVDRWYPTHSKPATIWLSDCPTTASNRMENWTPLDTTHTETRTTWRNTMPNEQKIVQKVCTRCGDTKPIKAFKRLLTLRQSSALLKRPTRTRLTVISSRCSSCWHDTKRKTPLTIKEIHRKKASGDIHPIVADLKIKAINQYNTDTINQVRSRKMKEVWHKRRVEPIAQSLKEQLAVYKARYFATKRKNQNNQTPDHALLRQHSEEYELAKQIRKELMARIKLNDIPTQTNIYNIIKQTKGNNHD